MSESDRVERQPLPPYVPYKTFVNFIDGLRVGMPSHIDRSVMKSYSGGIQSWLMSSLRFMKWIDDDGVPSERLQKLVRAEAADRKRLLADLFETTYSFLPLAGVDLKTTTPQKLDAAFGQSGAKGETIEKCIAFLKALAKDADVPISPYLKKASRRTRGAGGSIRLLRKNQHIGHESDEGDEPPPHEVSEKSSEQMLLEILDPDVMEEAEQKAVWTLLLYLKKQR
jgi:hypothetical protein